MPIDKLPPVYGGDNPSMKAQSEYENYLREQMNHELELSGKAVKDVQKSVETIKAEMDEMKKTVESLRSLEQEMEDLWWEIEFLWDAISGM